jgi:hypothetical protein
VTDQTTGTTTKPKAKAKKAPHELPGLVGDITRQTTAVLALKEEFGAAMEEDEDLARDMIEGSTDFCEVITAALIQIGEDEAFAAAKKDMANQIWEGAKRLETRVEKLKGAIARAMEIAGEPKVPTTAGTASLGDKPITAIITQEADIPSEFWIEQDPKLDKAALNKAIREGDVPGCVRSNGGKSLRITRR